jgi:hypothetical protein
MHNHDMTPASDMAWIEQEILHQVNVIVENFTMNDPAKLLQCSKVIVSSIVDKIDIKHALGMYYHMVEQAVDANTWTSSPDRLQCIYDHFNAWIELELAKRYA